jgi:hypothetical protein
MKTLTAPDQEWIPRASALPPTAAEVVALDASANALQARTGTDSPPSAEEWTNLTVRIAALCSRHVFSLDTPLTSDDYCRLLCLHDMADAQRALTLSREIDAANERREAPRQEGMG